VPAKLMRVGRIGHRLGDAAAPGESAEVRRFSGWVCVDLMGGAEPELYVKRKPGRASRSIDSIDFGLAQLGP
jgi:hypothetical protein